MHCKRNFISHSSIFNLKYQHVTLQGIDRFKEKPPIYGCPKLRYGNKEKEGNSEKKT